MNDRPNRNPRDPRGSRKHRPLESGERPRKPGPTKGPPRGKPGKQSRPAPAPTPRGGDTHWGDVAEWYDRLVGEEGSEYHQKVILPGLEGMIREAAEGAAEVPDVAARPLRVLDVACGQGVLCRKLAGVKGRQKGASGGGRYEVTGIDAAGPLVDAARRRNEGERGDGLPIRYLVGDARELAAHPELEAGSFDLVTIVLAIQNITPLSPVFKGCREVLRPGGRLILVMMHPCFRVPKGSDWHWDDRKHEEVRTVAHYLTSTKIGIQTHPGLAAHGKSEDLTTHFHRPLQAYVQTLAAAGLLVDHMEEWPSHKRSQPGPRARAIDRARQEIPMFLALRARRV